MKKQLFLFIALCTCVFACVTNYPSEPVGAVTEDSIKDSTVNVNIIAGELKIKTDSLK